MPANLQRTSWSFGQLSQRLLGRIDLDSYRAGCEKLENWWVNKSGSLDFRGGSEIMLDLEETDERLIPLRGGETPLIGVLGEHVLVWGKRDVGDDVEYTSSDRLDAPHVDVATALWAVAPNRYPNAEFHLFSPGHSPESFLMEPDGLSAAELIGNPDDEAGPEDGAVPDGDHVAAGVYYEQRLVIAGGADHRQTIIGSRGPNTRDGTPRYNDWSKSDQRTEDSNTARVRLFSNEEQTQGLEITFRLSADTGDNEQDVYSVSVVSGSEAAASFSGLTLRVTYADESTLQELRDAIQDIDDKPFFANYFDGASGGDTLEGLTLDQIVDDASFSFVLETTEVFADHGFKWTVDSGSEAAEIRWLAVYQGALIIGCDIGIAIAESLDPDGSPQIRWHSAQGVAPIQPAVTSFGVLAVSADRTSVYEVVRKRDMNLYEEDLFENDPIKEIAWQQGRQPRLFVVTEGGNLMVQTIHDPNRVLAWTPCPHCREDQERLRYPRQCWRRQRVAPHRVG